VRLCLIASKPTDAVTYGFLPAAERLGLEVFLTDQPEAHVGALARAAMVTAGWPAGTGPAGERALAGSVPGIAGRCQARNVPGIVPCDVHDTRALIGRMAGLPAMDAVFTNSDHLQMQVALATDETPEALAERCAEYFGRCPGGRLLAEEYLPGTLRTLAGAYAWNISHHDFLMHPSPAFHYLT